MALAMNSIVCTHTVLNNLLQVGYILPLRFTEPHSVDIVEYKRFCLCVKYCISLGLVSEQKAVLTEVEVKEYDMTGLQVNHFPLHHIHCMCLGFLMHYCF